MSSPSPSSTLLCVPLVSNTVEQMAGDMATAKSLGADLVEIRLDHLADFRPRSDLDLLLRNRPLPALVTYRPKWEGGQYEGDDNMRFEALRLAMEFGAEYIDIELQVAEKFISFISGMKPENFKLIVSSHNYKNTPSSEELGSLVARIQGVGADIVKIATTAVDIVDVAHLFQVIVHCQVPIIGLVMNERGLISRLLSPKFGGYLTFCTPDMGKESAPGQPTITDLLNVYNIRQIREDTKVFGLIGKPISHSKSPILHNALLRSVDLNAVYVPLLVDDLANFFKAYSSPDFVGFSCGIPHKQDAVFCCDEVDPIAKSIGAVNTIVRRSTDGKLIGYNTDYIGAISAIEDGIRGSRGNDALVTPLSGKLLVVMGAGGAGKALAYGAKAKGAKIVIANRPYEQALELANLVGGVALTMDELEQFQPEEGAILANATPVGMHPNIHGTPLPKHVLRSYSLVFDAIYTPRVTRFLREARESGVPVVSGVEMFLRQAMGQFELFTGLPAPEKLIRDIAMRIT